MRTNSRRCRFALGIIVAFFAVCTVLAGSAAAKPKSGGNTDGWTDNWTDDYLTNIELLGKYVFFDKISEPKRMALRHLSRSENRRDGKCIRGEPASGGNHRCQPA